MTTWPAYLGTPSSDDTKIAMADGVLGQMVTPLAGNAVTPGARWALDNGCFSGSWSVAKWMAALRRHQLGPMPSQAAPVEERQAHQRCLWAVVPDVVGDADGTDVLWARWHTAVMRHGYRAAYVAQNGCRRIPMGADALFIGGDTDWKLGEHARAAVREAHRRGMWVHMGRVNSLKRLRYAASIGCHSVDGTFLAFGPDKNLPQLLGWLNTDVPPAWAA